MYALHGVNGIGAPQGFVLPPVKRADQHVETDMGERGVIDRARSVLKAEWPREAAIGHGVPSGGGSDAMTHLVRVEHGEPVGELSPAGKAEQVALRAMHAEPDSRICKDVEKGVVAMQSAIRIAHLLISAEAPALEQRGDHRDAVQRSKFAKAQRQFWGVT